jgi:hypothetical protein
MPAQLQRTAKALASTSTGMMKYGHGFRAKKVIFKQAYTA